MKILIFSQHFAPEEVSGAVLATELAEDLVKFGNSSHLCYNFSQLPPK